MRRDVDLLTHQLLDGRFGSFAEGHAFLHELQGGLRIAGGRHEDGVAEIDVREVDGRDVLPESFQRREQARHPRLGHVAVTASQPGDDLLGDWEVVIAGLVWEDGDVQLIPPAQFDRDLPLGEIGTAGIDTHSNFGGPYRRRLHHRGGGGFRNETKSPS